MVWVGPRVVVTIPCAGCALPWNASFMTIPFEDGDFRESTNSVRAATRTGHPRPSGRGFRRLGRYRTRCMWLCKGIWVRPAARRRGVGPFAGVGSRAYSWRISAGYSTGGYPPVDRMPYGDPNAGVTRRNISNNCHAGRGTRRSPGQQVVRRGAGYPGEPRQVGVGALFDRSTRTWVSCSTFGTNNGGCWSTIG